MVSPTATRERFSLAVTWLAADTATDCGRSRDGVTAKKKMRQHFHAARHGGQSA
jgi:hypothetical protein